jgi:hypothetical protein
MLMIRGFTLFFYSLNAANSGRLVVDFFAQ